MRYQLLDEMALSIAPLDEEARQKAALRMNSLLKPPGSLGRLEELGTMLAGVQGREKPVVNSKLSLIYAADHGVVSESVSTVPASVTGVMVRAFCSGKAGINVLARQAGAHIRVIDIGVANDYDIPDKVILRRIRRGTGNMRIEECMTRDDAIRAISTGIETAVSEVRATGAQVVGVGEMGIGNTTSAAALTSVFTGRDPAEVTGHGTGLDDAGLERKIQIIREACRLHQPDPHDPIGVLSKIGGLEIAAMAGAMIGAASESALILIDGFISSTAALIAIQLAPNLHSRVVLSHLSSEPGHCVIARSLELVPLLDLKLRLGEGTGAALAMNLVESSAALLSEMGTLEDELVASLHSKKTGQTHAEK